MGNCTSKNKSKDKLKKQKNQFLDGMKEKQEAEMNQSADVQITKPGKNEKQNNKDTEPVITRQIIVEKALFQISSTNIQNQNIVSEGKKFAVDNKVSESQKFAIGNFLNEDYNFAIDNSVDESQKIEIKNIQEEGVNQSISQGEISIKVEEEIQQLEDQFTDYIYESHFDVAQNFKLNKWLLKEKNSETLLNMLKIHPKIGIVGVYGSQQESMEFINSLLEFEELPVINFKNSREGIIAFHRQDRPILCLFYKTQSNEVFEKKPFAENSKETIYIRLLLDLCSVIVCTPSQQIIDQ